MNDPLSDFAWSSLYARYDNRCMGFDANSPHLIWFVAEKPLTDRLLYYRLTEQYVATARTTELNPVALYECLLYWKLYSQPAARSQLAKWIAYDSQSRKSAAVALPRLLSNLPMSLGRDVDAIVELLKTLSEFVLPGMKSKTAIPVRSTFLHFLYPASVPIFDRMVLQAVGVDRVGSNHDYDVFREYLPFVWGLADKYATRACNGHTESSLRLIDMALWVNRGLTSAT